MRILDYLGVSVANLGVTSVAGLLQRVGRLGGAPPMQVFKLVRPPRLHFGPHIFFFTELQVLYS